jgi:ribonuclease R
MAGERTGVRYRLGDRLRVKISRVDLETSKIDFVLAAPLAASGAVADVVSKVVQAGRPSKAQAGRSVSENATPIATGRKPRPVAGKSPAGQKAGSRKVVSKKTSGKKTPTKSAPAKSAPTKSKSSRKKPASQARKSTRK